METKNFATFASTLPDDSVEQNDEIVTPSGRNVAESIAAELRARGGEASMVEQHSFYGWAFSGSVLQVPFWCLLQAPGAWLLIVEDRRWLPRRWFSKAGRLGDVLSAFDSALRGLSHISSVQWVTPSEYRSMARAVHDKRKNAQPVATANPDSAG